MTILHWLDLETTGLDPEWHQIIEVGVITTDERCHELTRFHMIMNPAMIVLERMDNFVRGMHTNSGLLDELARSVTGSYGLEDLETYLAQYSSKTSSYFAGSGVHFDLGFLKHKIPSALTHCHYRVLDVSALRLAREFQSGIPTPKGVPVHRSIPDCEYAIKEYKTFRVTQGGF